MISLLRALGVLNAAIWVGAGIFFTFFVGPAFFSEEMVGLLTKPYAGAAAQFIIRKLFLLQSICLLFAVAHLLVEYIYLGRHVARDLIAVLAVLFCLISTAGFGLQPKLRELHLVKYGPGATTEQREAADKNFKVWHGVAQCLNLLVMAGQLYYFYRLQSSLSTPRFVPTTKFRG